jgi:uncharacterized protein YbjT (DUF2867 family)
MNGPDRQRPETVLVLGGSGFVGRHAVEALRLAGRRTVIGTRFPSRPDRFLPEVVRHSERRETRFERLLKAGDWDRILEGIDVVLNCVGILRQRGHETYDRVHHLAPAALAAACRLRGIRLVHVSALGLEARARSRFLKSKRAGEVAIRNSGADWLVVRPSLLDGDGGFGATWLRRVARWPVHPVPAGDGRIAVLDVRDLGEALARLAFAPVSSRKAGIRSREFELGGPTACTLAEHLLALRRMYTTRHARQISIPSPVARLASHVCDLLHMTPFSYGHWELLGRDNRPDANRLSEVLGRMPRSVGLVGERIGVSPPELPAPM